MNILSIQCNLLGAFILYKHIKRDLNWINLNVSIWIYIVSSMQNQTPQTPQHKARSIIGYSYKYQIVLSNNTDIF